MTRGRATAFDFVMVRIIWTSIVVILVCLGLWGLLAVLPE